MTRKTSRPALVTFLLLFSTLHLLFWSSSSLVLSDSSSSLNKDQAKAYKAPITKGKSHVQPDPKFQELIDKYRASIDALERTIDGILPVIVGANLTLTIRVDLLLSLGVPIERADELEIKWKRVWDQWCAIAQDYSGPGLLTVAKKALKDFERVPSQASQSALESSVAALEAAVAPLEPILKGQPLWNFDGLLEHRDMTLYAAVYQDAVDAFIKVLDCEPDAEEAVNKVLQHLREVNLYRPEVTLSPRAKWSKKWLPVIKWGTFGLAISIAAGHIFNAIYRGRTMDTTSDIYQTIESITSDDDHHSTDAQITIYTDHITETIDDYGSTVVVALVICVVLLVATGVGLYYFLVNRNRKPTKDTNLEANKSTKCSSSSSSVGDGTSSKPNSKRS